MLGGWGRDSFSGYGQFDYKPCADGTIFLKPNRSAVVFNNPANDSKTQTCSAFLGRKIWQEQSLFQFLSYAMATVRNADLESRIIRGGQNFLPDNIGRN